MADPVLTVERTKLHPEFGKYPLAFKAGVMALNHLIIGGEIWSGCTKPQRAVLDALCRPVMARLLERGQLDARDLPELPASTTKQMRSALERRGLVEAGRITGRAVYAWYWAVGFKQRACGTGYGYRRHLDAGEEPCERCAEAITELAEAGIVRHLGEAT